MKCAVFASIFVRVEAASGECCYNVNSDCTVADGFYCATNATDEAYCYNSKDTCEGECGGKFCPGGPKDPFSPIDPLNSENITIYGIHPMDSGSVPLDVDTGDREGIIFFDFRNKVRPLECLDNPMAHDCTNPDVVGDLFMAKLSVEVDSRYGQYARCNACVNGSDGHGTDNCTDGEFICSCSEDETVHKDCPLAVGREFITDNHHGVCKDSDPEWQCWHQHMAPKAQGAWFSTVKSGYCGKYDDDMKQAPAGCTWRVVEKPAVISSDCNNAVMYDLIETYTGDSEDCFNSCDDSGLGKKRNTSSTCWTTCFFNSLLGKEAGKMGGKIEGVPMSDIVKAFDRSFIVCPPLDVPDIIERLVV